MKTSNDLEVYEIVQPSKDKLEEICDLRQPVLFSYNSPLPPFTTWIDSYGMFDVKIRKTDETDLLPLKLNAAVQLFGNSETKYISESNGEFIQETGLAKQVFQKEQWIRPYLVATSEYDILFGSVMTTTELKYEVNYRTYLYVSQGECTIKLIPPESGKHLSASIDYERFVFGSPVHLWDVQKEYELNVNKLNVLEFKIRAGQMLFIPAYWWYTLRMDVPQTCIATFKYKTFMNVLSILPHVAIHVLQLMNIKRKIAKKMENIEVKTPSITGTVTAAAPATTTALATASASTSAIVEEPSSVTIQQTTTDIDRLPSFESVSS